MALTNISTGTAKALANAAMQKLLGSTGALGGGGGDTSYAAQLNGVQNKNAFQLGNSLAQQLVGTSPGYTDNSGGYDDGGGYTDNSGGGGTYYASDSSGGGGGGYTAPVPVSTPSLALTGAAAKFTPVGLDQLIADPDALLKSIVDPSGQLGNGLYAQASPYADYANALYLAANGQNLDNGAGTKGDTVNWMDNFFKQLTTPGGGTLDFNQLAKNVLNPTNGSPLSSYLAEGDPGDQEKATSGLLGAIVNAGYNPLIANAINDRIKEAASDYTGLTAKGAQVPFYQYLLKNVPGAAANLLPGIG